MKYARTISQRVHRFPVTLQWPYAIDVICRLISVCSSRIYAAYSRQTTDALTDSVPFISYVQLWRRLIQAFFVDLRDGQCFHPVSEPESRDAARTTVGVEGDTTRRPATHARLSGASGSAIGGSRMGAVGLSRRMEQLISSYKDDTDLYESLKTDFDRCASLLAVLERSRGRPFKWGIGGDFKPFSVCS